MKIIVIDQAEALSQTNLLLNIKESINLSIWFSYQKISSIKLFVNCKDSDTKLRPLKTLVFPFFLNDAENWTPEAED